MERYARAMKNTQSMDEIVVSAEGAEERLEVSKIKRYRHDSQEPVEEGWNILGLHPDDTDLLGSGLTWLSGSLAGHPDELKTEDGEDKFPSVYVPDEYPVEIEVNDDSKVN